MSAPALKSLPMYFPSGFVQTEAYRCASLVLTAYDQFEQWAQQNYPAQPNFVWKPNGFALNYSEALWGTLTVFERQYPEPFGFVAWDGAGNAYVVFRGTMTNPDAVIDASIDQTPYTLAPGFGNVHVGWNSVYETMSPWLLAQLGKVGTITRLFFTGHSMGSAYSSLAVPDVAMNSTVPPSVSRSYVHYNFASPRLGDPGFAMGLNWNVQTPTFRVVNTEDIVPDVPPPLMGSTVYQHIGTPVDFTAEYLTTDGNHNMANCYYYAITNPTQPQGPMQALLRSRLQGRIEGPIAVGAY
ncbi:lipase family protein [Dyella halodurans]|uniref:Lipase family protein n=1 Tax=Dyella halodurans TaxID=1920171 RepID=A0ABV9C4F0_9GAMM|nr:lipase family protein [Dyella halodurans]